MNKRKLFIRLLVSPFILGLIITTYLFTAFKRWGLFLWFGGEFINYVKDEHTTIKDIYEELKKQSA